SIRLPATLTAEFARFLGLIIAEGHTSRQGNIWFVNADPALNDDFVHMARSLFDVKVFRAKYKARAEDSIIFSRTLGKALERLFDLRPNSKARDKTVPPQIFQSNPDVRWAFLSGLFEGDGHLHLRSSKAKADKVQAYIEYTTASRQLADQIA